MKNPHRIVSRSTWLAERHDLLEQEKRLTKLHDELSEKRRALPWVEIESSYHFEGAHGRVSLLDLFEGHSQLAVYHFMFAPERDVACAACTFWGDSFNGAVAHLAARDVAFTAISRAPYPKLQAYAQRFGFTFPWVSAGDNGFNAEFGVHFSEAQLKSGDKSYNFGSFEPKQADMPGISTFARDGERIFHTYSTFGRGIEVVNVTYQLLDLVSKGRDEAGRPMSWLKRRDEYALGRAS